MPIDLTDLRLFVHVADAASITRGAQRAHLAPASASERIKAMEAALGVALLVRGVRGVRLTAAGEALLGHARTVLGQMGRLRAELGAFASGERGRVRLLANTAALADLLPAALPSYLARHPQIELDVEERASEEIVRELLGARADIGVLADSADLSSLEAVALRLDPLVLAAPRTMSLPEAPLALADVLRHGFVGLVQDAALQRYVERAAGPALRVRARVRDFDALCRLVGEGAGLAVLPLAAARRHERALRIARLRDAWASRTLAAAVREAAALAPAARALLEHLRSAHEGMQAHEADWTTGPAVT